jgi:hypothetical protein
LHSSAELELLSQLTYQASADAQARMAFQPKCLIKSSQSRAGSQVKLLDWHGSRLVAVCVTQA